MLWSRIKTLTSTLLLSSLCLSPIVTADDTEIFYGRSSDAANTNPNILFILDTSGSMSNWDNTGQSRMDRRVRYSLCAQAVVTTMPRN